MQYTILNRFFPCKEALHEWNCEHDRMCIKCDIEENLEHYFFWWNRISECILNLGALDIIFGVMNETNDTMICVLNYCIIIAKKYINSCKLQNCDCVFRKFAKTLKQRLIVEEYIATVNHSLEEFIFKWGSVIDTL